MTLNRRTLLQALAAGTVGLPLIGCSVLQDGAGPSQPQIFASAVRFADGGDGVAAFSTDGRELWRARLPARGHGGAISPDGRHLVLFERRPGWQAHVIDLATGEITGELPLGDQEHFYGHGVFSPDGTRLYVTINQYNRARGLVAVYEKGLTWRRVDTFDLEGVGPHQIAFNPVDDTLAVALGGIETHPDYPRLKLNLDTMDPALVILDRHTGRVIAHHRPSHHQLSCRHLAITHNGSVWVGYQYQGPAHHRPPLMARLGFGANGVSRFEEFHVPDELSGGVDNYIASVAASPDTGLVALTAPRGGAVVVMDGESGLLVGTFYLADVAGVTAVPGGGFLLSTGTGKLAAVRAGQREAILQDLNLSWDNHLIA